MHITGTLLHGLMLWKSLQTLDALAGGVHWTFDKALQRPTTGLSCEPPTPPLQLPSLRNHPRTAPINPTLHLVVLSFESHRDLKVIIAGGRFARLRLRRTGRVPKL